MARTKKSVDDQRRARLMRLTKAELARLVMDQGVEIMDLQSHLEELNEGADFIGAVEHRVAAFCRTIVDPSAHQLVVMAGAVKLAQVLDGGGDTDRSVASTEKQLLDTCNALAASAKEGETATPLFSVPTG